jgi:hypothetical protein
MKNLEKIYYTYVYLNPLKSGKFEYEKLKFNYSPFYVGKGKGKRMFHHYNNKTLNSDLNKHKTNTIKQILRNEKLPIIVKFSEKLFENEAFDDEIFLIKTIGRSDLNLGPLTNMTNGGDGCSGHLWQIGRKHTEETKKKISDTLKKTSIWVTNNPSKTKEHREMMSKLLKGRKFSNETRRKISESSKGKKLSKETKKKIGESTKQRIEIYKTKEYRNKISKANKGKKRNNIHKLNMVLGKKKTRKLKLKLLNDIIFTKENINLSTNEIMKVINLDRSTINRIKKNEHWSAYLDLKDMKIFKSSFSSEEKIVGS